MKHHHYLLAFLGAFPVAITSILMACGSAQTAKENLPSAAPADSVKKTVQAFTLPKPYAAKSTPEIIKTTNSPVDKRQGFQHKITAINIRQVFKIDAVLYNSQG